MAARKTTQSKGRVRKAKVQKDQTPAPEVVEEVKVAEEPAKTVYKSSRKRVRKTDSKTDETITDKPRAGSRRARSEKKEANAKPASVEKKSRTRRAKKEVPAEPADKVTPKGLSPDELLKKYAPSKNLKREPKPADFNWKPLKRKNVWDGKPGVWMSRDPMATFKDYPGDFVIDPVTGVLPMARLKTTKKTMLPEETLFKVDRKVWLKTEEGAKFKKDNPSVLAVEYFYIVNERVFVIATSAGPKGDNPVDALNRQ